ncbi:MAG: pyridoxamine 5'-phosphate oxidase [Nitrospirae bacterium]|nr:pyridoxamine 5'-phosphate oxidase [Nitrospirota bacterium]
MKLTREIIDALRIKSQGDIAVYLTTCSVGGKCNVSPQFFTDIYEDEFILMPDLFAIKTKINLNENRVGVVTVAYPAEAKAWALRGPCGHIEWGLPDNYVFQGVKAGDILKKWGDWSGKEPFSDLPQEIRPSVIAQRGVIVLKVAECLSFSAGDSGRKIL